MEEACALVRDERNVELMSIRGIIGGLLVGGVLTGSFLWFHHNRQRPIDQLAQAPAEGASVRTGVEQQPARTSGIDPNALDAPPGAFEESNDGFEIRSPQQVDRWEDERSSEAGPDFLGSVIDDENGGGVPGCTVKLWSTSGILERAVTDAAGGFSFRLPEGLVRSDAWLEAVAPDDWLIEENTLDLTMSLASMLDASDGFVFRAQRDLLAALEYRLVDAESGASVPYYQLIFRRPDGGFERPRSNSQGILRTHTQFPPGPVQFYERDHPSMSSRPFVRGAEASVRVSGAEVPTLAVHPGPTFKFDLTLPEDIPQHRFEVLFSTAAEHSIGGEVLGVRTPLRGGEGAYWARFPPLAHLYGEDEGPFSLQIIDSAGRWQGRVRVKTRRGHAPEPVSIALTGRARFEGLATLVDAMGVTQLVGDVLVRLEPLDALERGREWSWPKQVTGSNGVFEFKGLRPGRYHMRAQSVNGLICNEVVTLAAGPSDPGTIVMSVVECMRVQGIVTSQSGRYRRPTSIELRPVVPGGAAMLLRHTVRWRRQDEVTSGSFDFGLVPRADYRLQVLGATDEDSFEPESLRLGADDTAADTEQAAIGFLALDLDQLQGRQESTPSDAAAIVRPRPLLVRYRIGGETREEYFEGDSFSLCDRVPDDHVLRYAVFAEGSRPVYGREQDLRRIEPQGRLGVHIERDELEPGWGRIVFVQDTEGRPLGLVDIFMDGSPCGRTWADGRVVIGADKRPLRLRAQIPGWHEVDRFPTGLTIQVVMGRD
ncbi:MAG: hypothetical protein ACI835_000755 [Planctomycetota bacterium]|jgi:hypothetical protein